MSLSKIIEKLHLLAYMTQPGAGHSMPSGQISLPSKQKVLTEDELSFWDKTMQDKTQEPVGDNKPTKTYRGPHNDREFRRAPHVTVKNVIPPRGVRR